MAQKPAKIALSQQHLMTLLMGRKYKEFHAYIAQIEKMNEDAQEAVIAVLERVFIQKKEKNPTAMLGALMLYKTLMVSACFDFTFSEDYFPMAAHEELAKICQYKPQIELFSNRGSDYFCDLFKIAKTEQNRQVLERNGNSYVLMALELLQSMAIWYPQDYFNTKAKSFFKEKYDELTLKKKVTFPKRDQLLIIKKVDEESFKGNYQRFKKRMDQLDEEPSPPKKKQEVQAPPSAVNKQPPKAPVVKAEPVIKKAEGNSLNIQPSNKPNQASDQMLKITGDMVSAVPAPPKKEVSMIATKPGNIFETNQLAKKAEEQNPTLSQKKEVKAPTKEQPKQNPNPPVTVKVEEKREVFEESQDEDDMPMPQEQSTKIIKQAPKQVKGSIVSKEVKPAPVAPPSKIVEQSKLKPTISEIKPKVTTQIKQQPSQAPPPPQASQHNPHPQNPSAIIQPSSARKQKTQQKPKQKPQQKPKEVIVQSQVKEISRPVSNEVPAKPPSNSLNIKSGEDIQKPFSFNNRGTAELGQTARKEVTPRKIQKMQRVGESYQASPNKLQIEQLPPQSKRPRSLPKTQKRYATGINFFQPVKATKQFEDFGIAPTISKEVAFNKTLSFFAKNRPRNHPSKQIYKSLNLNAILSELRLDEHSVPFIPKYFQPITKSMHALRVESLTLFNSGTSSNNFFSNNIMECRLVKEQDHGFSLMVQNVSPGPLLIEYVDMKGLKHSNRVKIISWANRSEISPYEIPRKGYMDIKFRFTVFDLNFKFLNFLLKVNGKVESLVLPITLLDMCQFVTPINHQQIYKFSMTGSIIISQQFVLDRQLPQFLGGFRFTPLANSRKRELRQIVGECTICLQNEGEDDGNLVVVVRVNDWQRKTVELNIIYFTKSQYSEDLAKVLMYLLVFLLKDA